VKANGGLRSYRQVHNVAPVMVIALVTSTLLHPMGILNLIACRMLDGFDRQVV
jgi:hypothetical protein